MFGFKGAQSDICKISTLKKIIKLDDLKQRYP